MARIRSVKPEFFKHERLFDAEQEAHLPLRIAFAGLWCVADREGRFRWRPRTLKSDVLPFDDVDFAAVLAALEQCGFIISYEVDGEKYGYIPSFLNHQHVNMREAASTLPAPDGCTHVHAHGEGERKGKGNGTESRSDSESSASKPERSSAPAARGKNGHGRYAFEGKVIRLTGADYKRWLEAYPDIDLRAELTALDDHYDQTLTGVERSKKWFPRCSQALANRQERARATKRPQRDDEWGLYN